MKDDPLLIATVMLKECGDNIVTRVSDATAEIVVNAYLGAAINFAFESGGSVSSVQTAFRKAAEITRGVFRKRASMMEVASESDTQKGSPIITKEKVVFNG